MNDDEDPISDLWEQAVGEWWADDPLPEPPETEAAEPEPSITEEVDDTQNDDSVEPLPEDDAPAALESLPEEPEDTGVEPEPEPVQSDDSNLDSAPEVEEPSTSVEPEPQPDTAERDEYETIEMLAPPVDEPEPMPANVATTRQDAGNSFAAASPGEDPQPVEQLAYDPTGAGSGNPERGNRISVDVSFADTINLADSIAQQITPQLEEMQSKLFSMTEDAISQFSDRMDRYNLG